MYIYMYNNIYGDIYIIVSFIFDECAGTYQQFFPAKKEFPLTINAMCIIHSYSNTVGLYFLLIHVKEDTRVGEEI